MSDGNYTSTNVSQSGKSGGDAFGVASAGSMGISGDTSGVGYGASAGLGGISGVAEGVAGAAGAVGGDVSDNTSIGSININS